MRKFSGKLNIVFVVSLVFASLIAIVPQRAQAAVAFNTFPISFTPTLNNDLPLIDARNVSRGGSFSASQSDHDNGVQAETGEEIEFQIYYHNSGIPEDVATNVLIRANLPGGTRSAHEVWASIDSDQTSPVFSSDTARGGNITVYISGSSQTLEFVSGSARHFPNRSTSGQFISGGDNIFLSGINIGSVQGCFEFSGFVTFRARVGSQVSESRNLSIAKRVLNVTRNELGFRDSTAANPGDRIRYEIRFETSGSAGQNNVIARDILPGRLSFVGGSLRIDGALVGNESEFFGSGRNFGFLSPGTVRIIIFEATVAGASQFSGTASLTNTANVRSDQVSTRQDEADVLVQLVSGVQFTLSKTAFNLTQGVDATSVAANPGDVIVYTLRYRNSGQTQISGATIEDDIHDVLELAEITNQGEAVSVNSAIRWAVVDVPPGVEITKTFQVRIRPASLFPASTDLVMVNVYGNEVRIPVRRPQVVGVTTPPRTGASEWLALGLASAATIGYWLYCRRKILARKMV